MVRKLKDKKKAIEMRGRGYSLNEIADKLNVSKASVSLWVREVPLTPKAKGRINERRKIAREKVSNVIKNKTIEKEKEADNFAEVIVEKLDNSELPAQLILAMIYWCEGNKSLKDSVFFTNSDPKLIRTFVGLLRKSFVLDEKKFRVCMHLHGYHKDVIQKKFWAEVTGIPESQFIKSYQKKHTSKQTNEGYQGCVQIRYYDVRIARKLLALARRFMLNFK